VTGGSGQQAKLNRRTTFVVSAIIGRFVGSPWPLGRLYICDDAITVRTVFKERTCLKSEITEISLERFELHNQLLFEDAAGEMAEVAVLFAMRVTGVVAELRRRGYPVVDRRPRFLPLPQGVVPWHDPDDEIEDEPPGR
jgi:hypothetical protein